MGYFATGVYDPELFWPAYAWELAVKLCVALTFLKLARSFGSRLGMGFAVLVCMVVEPGEALYWCFLVALVVILAREPHGQRGFLLYSVGPMALLSLVKFMLLVIALLAVGFLELRHRSRHWRSLRSPLVLYVICLAVGWAALGQSLANFPAYIWGGLEIIRGYGEAMTWTSPEELRALVPALTVWCVFPAALLFLCLRQRQRAAALGFAGFLMINLFVAWKYSFSRADAAHVHAFFSVVLFLALAAAAYFPREKWSSWVKAGLLSLCGLALCAGSSYRYVVPVYVFPRFGKNLVHALAPARLQGRLQAQREELEREWELPAVRARVADVPVDLISCAQGLLFLNYLTYRPRPVFQSYSAYTPALIALNARYFRGDRAPPYVLLKLDPLDNHFPTLDDSQALLEVFRRYRPVLMERDYLLLERGPAGAEGTFQGELIVEQTVRFGEELALGELPGRFRVISLDIRASGWGGVRKLLYKPPEVLLHARTASGATYTSRIIPGMAGSGFLIDPFLEDAQDVLDLYHAAEGKRVVAFSITTGAAGSFREELGVTIQCLPPQAWYRSEPVAQAP